MLFNKKIISAIFLLSTILIAQDPCEDFVIEEFPYYSGNNPDDPGTTIGMGNDWYFENKDPCTSCTGDNLDVAYKIELDINRTLYIDTCDPLTTFDTMIAVKTACYDSSSFRENDDGRQGWCQEVNPPLDQSYPCIIDTITLLADSTYYIIIDGYGGANGNYGLVIGTVPTILSSSIAADDSYIEIIFSDPVYSNSIGSGAVEIEDFEIQFSQNGGNATNVEISNQNARDILEAERLNRAEDRTVFENKVAAWEQFGKNMGTFTGDAMKFLTDQRIADAIAGETGITEANRFFRANPDFVVNGQITEEGQKAYEQYQQQRRNRWNWLLGNRQQQYGTYS